MIDKIGRAALFAKTHFKTAIDSAKELTGKSIYKARGLKNKVVATNAKIKKDYSVRKSSWAKDFAGEVRSEGRLLRKNVFTTKNVLDTGWNYPITTGAVVGLSLGAALSKKDKKKKKV
tara:strand:- start:363 stop:716 length:354 start_codon:yes stop_codon:yes gene_type:complete